MKKLIYILSLLTISISVFSQELVFQENFDSNDKEWNLLRTNVDQAKIFNSTLYWKHNEPHISQISQYVNRLNDVKDFEVSATLKPYKLSSEYGMVFGGISRDNANYILLKGKKFKFVQIKNGKVTIDKKYKTNLSVRLDENKITIVRRDNTVKILVNDKVLVEESVRILMGKNYGFALAGNSEVAMDNLKITGNKLEINIVPDLFYNDKPENLGAAINSKYEELTPVISPNGKGLFFTRRYSPDNAGGSSDHQDIYYSGLYQGKWTTAHNVGKPLNNHGPNAVCAVTPDGNKVLLINTYTKRGEQKGSGLSISKKTADGWSIPEDVRMKGYYNRSQFNEFMLSNDGKTMILAIDRNDTKGGRDLYVSFLESNSTWSSPKNLGLDINTSGTELSPFLASDGVTLYFSSTGHPGYGKNDIFLTKRLDDSWTKWSTPKNLGKPLNSVGWDAYYSVPASGDYAYYVSTDNSLGLNDIFRIKLPTDIRPEPVVLIRGKVLNSKTQEPIATGVSYEDLVMGKEVGIARSDAKTGEYEIVLPLSRVYGLFAQKEGFYSVNDNLDLSDVTEYKEIEKDLYLTPIEIGQTVQLNNVFFYRGQPKLQSSSFTELDRLVTMLTENENLEILLEGHTDNQGNQELNVKLSKQRVEAVKNYLVEKGIEESRITGKGWGGEKPIADNSREATRKLNRRVEFKITKF